MISFRIYFEEDLLMVLMCDVRENNSRAILRFDQLDWLFTVIAKQRGKTV